MTSQTYRGEVDIVNHHSILRELAILRTIMQQQEKERRKKERKMMKMKKGITKSVLRNEGVFVRQSPVLQRDPLVLERITSQ